MKQVIPADTLLANLDMRFLQEAIEKLLKAMDILQLKKYVIDSEVYSSTPFNTPILRITRWIILRFLKIKRL